MKKSIILVFILFIHASVSYSQSISGRLVDDSGNGKAGMELKAYIHPNIYGATSAADGTFSLKITTGLERLELPTGYEVSDIYPNPFSFTTSITVTIPANGDVSCDIFNIQGQKVKESSNFRCGPGVHNLNIDFQGLSDGFYLLKIKLHDRYSVSRKVMLKQGSPNSSSQILPVAGLRLNTPKQENAVIKIDSLVVTGADVERKVFVDVDNIVDNILDLGDINISETLSIEEDDFENSYAPLAITGVSGSGFDTKNMALRFFDERGFVVTIPAVYSTDEFMICSLPAYVNITTGEIESGVVKVQAVKDLGKLSITSNIKSGIGIGALPALTLPPGTIASNFYDFMELLLSDEITSLEELDQISGSVINTVQFRAELENSRLLCRQIVDKIRLVMNGQSQSELAGDINGTKVYLNTASLQILDQWLLAVVNGISPETTQTLSGVLRYEDNQTFPYILKINAKDQHSTDVIDYFNCSINGGGNCDDKDYRKQILPKTANELSRLGKMAGYGTFAIGAGLTLGVGCIPLKVVALLGVPGLEILGTKMMMDATVLSMNYDDKAAAKRVAEDLEEYFKMVANGVNSQIISAWKGDKAGVFYDFLTTFESELKTLGSSFVAQSLSYIQFKPEPVTYTGTLNGVQIEESEKATITYTITSTVKITLSGNGTLIYPYGGKIVVTGNVAPTAVSHPPWQVTVTGGPFTLPGSVYGTQSNVSGTISKYVVFSNGTVNENSLTGNISFTVGCGWGCADPIKQSITLNK